VKLECLQHGARPNIVHVFKSANNSPSDGNASLSEQKKNTNTNVS